MSHNVKSYISSRRNSNSDGGGGGGGGDGDSVFVKVLLLGLRICHPLTCSEIHFAGSDKTANEVQP